jgi:hypothetical protein
MEGRAMDKFSRWDWLLLGIASLLMLPLAVSWLSYFAPLLGLCGITLASGLVIAKTSKSLVRSCLAEYIARRCCRTTVTTVEIIPDRREISEVGLPTVPIRRWK